MRQKQGRRKSNLMKKAREYSKLCEADVCVGIRLRETGQVFILSADVSGFWGFLRSQLVRSRHESHDQRLNFLGLLLSDPIFNYRSRPGEG